jgi:hypothetical protein
MKNRASTCLPIVERMLKLHKDLPKARTAPDKTAITKMMNGE